MLSEKKSRSAEKDIAHSNIFRAQREKILLILIFQPLIVKNHRALRDTPKTEQHIRLKGD
jgi:hypothetical protein